MERVSAELQQRSRSSAAESETNLGFELELRDGG
jgi:hypothetical protein